MEAKDLLIADLQQFGESLWRNEEVGEKRFEFFVTLTTAVGAGLVALATSDRKVSAEDLRTIATVALGALLVLGLLSYLRVLHRNSVTDEYQRTLRYVRERYKQECPGLVEYRVPLRTRSWRARWLRAGYAETLAVLDGMLLAALLAAGPGLGRAGSAISGLALTTGLWAFASVRKKGDGKERRPPCYFRAGVGAVIRNDRGHVLAFERSGARGAWQLPQGGLEEGEGPEAAISREIWEETGLRAKDMVLVARTGEPLVYELPPDLRNTKVGMGQVQHWFLYEFRGEEKAIDLKGGGEFQAWSWQPFDRLLADVVSFRKPVYERLRAEFGLSRP